MDVWQTEQGLPENAVSAILQSNTGYLWIGTFNGLARFDGVRFVVFDSSNTPALRSGRITNLFEDEAGVLWIGEETGGVACLDSKGWHTLPLPKAWPGGSIHGITEDETGSLWVLNRNGMLLRLRDGFILPQAPRRGRGQVPLAMLYRDRYGRAWVLRERTLSMLHEGALQPWNPPRAADAEVLMASPSADGGMWILSAGRIRKWRGIECLADLGTGDLRDDDTVTAIREVNSDEVVIATMASGLHWVSGSHSPRALGWSEGMASDFVRDIIQDREGDFWAATAGGLDRLRLRRAEMLGPSPRWQGKALRTVSSDHENQIWIGTEGAGIYSLTASDSSADAPAPSIGNPYVWSSIKDRTGRIWAGTWGGGLFLQQGERFTEAPGWIAQDKIVTALFESRDGTIWAGTENGLACYRDNRWNSMSINGQETLGSIRTIAEDQKGAIWFGTSGAGLGCLKENKMTLFTSRDGLPSDFIWSLYPDSDANLWIGTFGGGLCRWDGRKFTSLSTAQGLPNNVICHMEQDSAGNFWISSFGGIFRAAKIDLNHCADGSASVVPCLLLGKSDGLATLECCGGFQPAGAKTADGRLWFPTNRGVAIIDPSRIEPSETAPSVLIESIRIDEQPGRIAEGSVVIPPGRHRLEVNYTGLSFAAPEKVRFRHRLADFDPQWRDAGNQRQAVYSYLPPGNYRFEVKACNGDGVWSAATAGLAITAQPHFWQTWWFYIATAALVTALLAGLYRIRIGHLHAVELLRLHIARDLHDEIGSNLGSIALLSEAMEKNPKAVSPGEIRKIAAHTVEMMREIVWLTNPAHDRLSELVPRMREIARHMLNGMTYDFECRDLPEELLLPPAWRHHFLPIFKESLHNAAQHSRAERVQILLRSDRRYLELIVEDDGCGFDPAEIVPGNGLLNLNRRAQEAGAELEIAAQTGRGTKVALRLKLP